MLKGFNVRNKGGLLDTVLKSQSNYNSYYDLLSSKKDKQITSMQASLIKCQLTLVTKRFRVINKLKTTIF